MKGDGFCFKMLTGLLLDLYSYRGRGVAQLDKHQARYAADTGSDL